MPTEKTEAMKALEKMFHSLSQEDRRKMIEGLSQVADEELDRERQEWETTRAQQRSPLARLSQPAAEENPLTEYVRQLDAILEKEFDPPPRILPVEQSFEPPPRTRTTSRMATAIRTLRGRGGRGRYPDRVTLRPEPQEADSRRFTYDMDGNRVSRDELESWYNAPVPAMAERIPERLSMRASVRETRPNDENDGSPWQDPLPPTYGSNGGSLGRDRDRPDEPSIRLRAADVMLFDPEETYVMAFVSRLEFMATQEGENALLRVFPLRLKGRALQWHNSLSSEMRQEMAHSLPRTIAELQLEFKLSEGEAWTKAQGLRFSFQKSNELPLALYISRKINLLRAASIFDPTMDKRLIWEVLESNLSLITPLVPNERLDDFRRRIRDNESAARRAGNDNKTQFSEYTRSSYRRSATAGEPANDRRAYRNSLGSARIAEIKASPNPPSAAVFRSLSNPPNTKRSRENLRPLQPQDAICGGAHYANRCPKRDGSNDRQANQVEDVFEDEDALSELGPCPDSDTEPEN
ncbi:hypothetical protein ACJ73_00646 [Blastomyces percursus]|uniref:Retrotransposon gag domain-containing protein n=1 Tax=Blastomyces percursus TaxID=1658174 RepID=A0A1J9RIZ7_9EURO|nr:hypothetical protein ACJ73_00646 [Blastomyces percursus]